MRRFGVFVWFLLIVPWLLLLCQAEEGAPAGEDGEDLLENSVNALGRFFEESSSVQLTSLVHHKIHHSGELTRDDEYVINTMLAREPERLRRELVVGGKPAATQVWDGGEEMWFALRDKQNVYSTRVGKTPAAHLGINHKFALRGVKAFLPNGLFLWENLFYEDDLDGVLKELKGRSRFLRNEEIRSQPCWVIEAVYKKGELDSPAEEYVNQISSQLWIRKADGAPVRSVFDQVASQGAWQMHNRFTADFVDLERDVEFEDATFEFIAPKGFSVETWQQRKRQGGMLPVLAVGSKAPDFEAVDLEGASRHLSNYDEDIVVITFSAPTCSNCRAFYPQLQKIHDAFGDSVAVLPLYYEDRPEIMRNYFERNKLSLVPLRVDRRISQTLYHVSGTPTTYVVDREGEIQRVFIGYPNDAPEVPPAEFDVFRYVKGLLGEQGVVGDGE